jgi:uncharacterized protein YjiS (DUF1127 family)
MIRTANDYQNSSAKLDMHDDRRFPLPNLVFGVVLNALLTVQTWRERARSRRELAARSSHELQDIGVCRANIDDEVSKPFWRA